MELELMMYKAYTHNVIWFLKVGGLWPEAHPLSRRIRSMLTLCSVSIIMATVSNFSFHNVSNVMVLTRGMSVAVSFSSAFSKVVLFLLRRDDLDYLNKHLSKGFASDMNEPENRPNLLKGIKTFNRFMITHAVSTVMAVSMFIIRPLMALRKHGKYAQIYPTTYPFTYEPGGLVHWIIFAIEMAGALSLGTVTIGVDCVFGVYAFQVCGQLRILGEKFRELRSTEKYKEKLKDCIQRHYMLMHAKNKINNIYGLISIWLAISGALVLCSLIFQVAELLKTNSSYLHSVHLCIYLIPKFLQIFTYAWYGNLITEESEACLDAMYDSHWTDSCDKNFKSDILIVLTQEPFALIAMGCMIIQLDMFTKIVKTSVSYFFLLQTLNEKN